MSFNFSLSSPTAPAEKFLSVLRCHLTMNLKIEFWREGSACQPSPQSHQNSIFKFICRPTSPSSSFSSSSLLSSSLLFSSLFSSFSSFWFELRLVRLILDSISMIIFMRINYTFTQLHINIKLIIIYNNSIHVINIFRLVQTHWSH